MSPIRCAVITISDRSSAGTREDLSGPALVDHVTSLGWEVTQKQIIPDNLELISHTLQTIAENSAADVILTTGGTGCAPRDVTPEATRAVIEKEIPGLSEVMRQESIKVNPHAMLSRQVCGICKNSLIINLPGSPKAAVENIAFIEKVIPHAVSLICSDSQAESGHQFSK